MFTIRTILYPTDFSDHSEYAFQVACAWPAITGPG